MDIYIQSSKYMDERFLIFRTINNDNTIDKVIKLNNNEVSEEIIGEINKFIKDLKEDNIKLYVVGTIIDNKGTIKKQWAKSKEAKEFIDITSNLNIEVYNFKGLSSLATELMKVIVNHYRAKKRPKITINNKEYRLFSDYTGTHKEINLYIRGIANYLDEYKRGYSIAVLQSSVNKKELYFKKNNTTSNRMLLIACIGAIKQLKEPCAINLYTHAHLGLSGGSVNNDLKEELFKLLREGNHCINEYVSMDNQEYLNNLIIDKFKQ